MSSSCDEAAIGDGDAMRVAREIAQHFRRTSEWSFTVDDPRGVAQRCQISGEGSGISESNVLPEELELSGLVSSGEHLQDPSAEQARENADGEQEVGSAGDPALTIKGDTTAWDDHMVFSFSQRSTWPPSAAVRQFSIADMTFNWPRLT